MATRQSTPKLKTPLTHSVNNTVASSIETHALATPITNQETNNFREEITTELITPIIEQEASTLRQAIETIPITRMLLPSVNGTYADPYDPNSIRFINNKCVYTCTGLCCVFDSALAPYQTQLLLSPVNINGTLATTVEQALHMINTARTQLNADWNATSGVTAIRNKPHLATVATTGNYNSLVNTPDFADVACSGCYCDLCGLPTIPPAQVNSDWLATEGVAVICNKPELSCVACSGNYCDLINKPDLCSIQQQSDWNQADSNCPTYIKNKPNLARVATSGLYADLLGAPSIPEQVNSDWLALSGPAYICNKPSLSEVAISGDYNDLRNIPPDTSKTYTFSFDESTHKLAVTEHGLFGDTVIFNDTIDTAYSFEYEDNTLTITDNRNNTYTVNIGTDFYTKCEVNDLISAITDLIPEQATPTNQLADKDFVNSSIATNTANFCGTFTNLACLCATVATPNDYAFYVHCDTCGNCVYDRYKYNANCTWVCEYTLNNSSFTANQWAAINSGITSTAVAKITDVYNCTVKLCNADGTALLGSFTLNQNCNTCICLDVGSGTVTGIKVYCNGSCVCKIDDNTALCLGTNAFNNTTFTSCIDITGGCTYLPNTSNITTLPSLVYSCTLPVAGANNKYICVTYTDCAETIFYINYYHLNICICVNDTNALGMYTNNGICATCKYTNINNGFCYKLVRAGELWISYKAITQGNQFGIGCPVICANRPYFWCSYDTSTISGWSNLTNCNNIIDVYCSYYYNGTLCCVCCCTIYNGNCLKLGALAWCSCNLCTVATSGKYCDLTGIPTIPTVNNKKITICHGAVCDGSFTLNQADDCTITLPAYPSDCLVKLSLLCSNADRAILQTGAGYVSGCICPVYASSGVSFTYNACCGDLKIGNFSADCCCCNRVLLSCTNGLSRSGPKGSQTNAFFVYKEANCLNNCSLGVGIGSGNVNRGFFDYCKASESATSPTFRWLQYWDSEKEIHNLPIWGPLGDNNKVVYSCVLATASNTRRYALVCFDKTCCGAPSTNSACFEIDMYTSKYYVWIDVASSAALFRTYWINNGVSPNASIYGNFCAALPDTTQNGNCFWITYSSYRAPVIKSARKISIICDTTTAPSGITFSAPTNRNSYIDLYCGTTCVCTLQGPSSLCLGCNAFNSTAFTTCTGDVVRADIADFITMADVDACDYTTCKGTITILDAQKANSNVPIALCTGATFVGKSVSCSLTFNTCTGIFCTYRMVNNAYPQKWYYTINLTTDSSSNNLSADCFYPVTWSATGTYEADIEIQSPSGSASLAYNQNYIHFYERANGWSDMPKSVFVQTLCRYADTENVFGCIGYGNKAGATSVIWLRGGRNYYVAANVTLTPHASNWSTGSTGDDSTFTVGTSLCGGTNTNVQLFPSATSFNMYHLGNVRLECTCTTCMRIGNATACTSTVAGQAGTNLLNNGTIRMYSSTPEITFYHNNASYWSASVWQPTNVCGRLHIGIRNSSGCIASTEEGTFCFCSNGYMYGNVCGNLCGTATCAICSVLPACRAMCNITTSNWYKIRLNDTSTNHNCNFMIAFTVNVMAGYQNYGIRISGYRYTNASVACSWHQLKAEIIYSSTNTATTPVYLISKNVLWGYDTVNNINYPWVAIQMNSYYGITITDITNAHLESPNPSNQFTTSLVTCASLNTSPSTCQGTITACYNAGYACNSTCFNGCTYAQACADIRSGLISDVAINVYCGTTCKCTLSKASSLCLGSNAFNSTAFTTCTGTVTISDTSASTAIPLALCTGSTAVGKSASCSLTYTPSTGTLCVCSVCALNLYGTFTGVAYHTIEFNCICAGSHYITVCNRDAMASFYHSETYYYCVNPSGMHAAYIHTSRYTTDIYVSIDSSWCQLWCTAGCFQAGYWCAGSSQCLDHTTSTQTAFYLSYLIYQAVGYQYTICGFIFPASGIEGLACCPMLDIWLNNIWNCTSGYHGRLLWRVNRQKIEYMDTTTVVNFPASGCRFSECSAYIPMINCEAKKQTATSSDVLLYLTKQSRFKFTIIHSEM